jgi:hypothetical protein
MLEIGELTGQPGPPTPAAIAEVPARHDIQQLTPLPVGQQRQPGGRLSAARDPPRRRTSLANPPGRPAPPSSPPFRRAERPDLGATGLHDRHPHSRP